MAEIALALRLQAPLMSFGGVKIDGTSPTLPFPTRSMLTGLFANALGYQHGDFGKIQRLQARLRLASRLDHPGEPLIDYQTVDLGDPDMIEGGWTTDGVPEYHGGGSATATHQRYVHYLADACVLSVVTLMPSADGPSIEQLAAALLRPARPLFLGRKCCLPSGQIYFGHLPLFTKTVRDALAMVPFLARGQKTQPPPSCLAQWPAECGGSSLEFVRPVVDDRDWANGVHVGQRLVREGLVRITPSPAFQPTALARPRTAPQVAPQSEAS